MKPRARGQLCNGKLREGGREEGGGKREGREDGGGGAEGRAGMSSATRPHQYTTHSGPRPLSGPLWLFGCSYSSDHASFIFAGNEQASVSLKQTEVRSKRTDGRC